MDDSSLSLKCCLNTRQLLLLNALCHFIGCFAFTQWLFRLAFPLAKSISVGVVTNIYQSINFYMGVQACYSQHEREDTRGMTCKEGFIWRDAFLYQCDLRHWSTNCVLLSEHAWNVNGQTCMSNRHKLFQHLVPLLCLNIIDKKSG